MHFITLESETDFGGWRAAARALALSDVAPAEVTWTVRGNEPELFEPGEETPPLEPRDGTFNVPARFVELAQAAILHRDVGPGRDRDQKGNPQDRPGDRPRRGGITKLRHDPQQHRTRPQPQRNHMKPSAVEGVELHP